MFRPNHLVWASRSASSGFTQTLYTFQRRLGESYEAKHEAPNKYLGEVFWRSRVHNYLTAISNYVKISTILYPSPIFPAEKSCITSIFLKAKFTQRNIMLAIPTILKEEFSNIMIRPHQTTPLCMAHGN